MKKTSSNIKIKVETKGQNHSNKTNINNINITKNSFDVLASPTKSQSDKKEYKVIKLKNGLTACIISDMVSLKQDEQAESSSDSDDYSSDENSEVSSASDQESEAEIDGTDDVKMKKVNCDETKMAAAALCVGVGSFSDPKEIPGLAHFLEHMVFMGSKKYPKENHFDSFIKKRGGSDNASTDCELTTFYFECLEKHLYKALDIFAQFFISPLMKQSAMTREREAIESEFQIALPKDFYRKEQLLCSLANKNSPVNSFSWGNLITLRDNISDDQLYESLHKFRKRHYSSHRMTLAIQARIPMHELEAYVVDCFSKVPNNNLEADDFSLFHNKIFNTDDFTKMYYIKPTKDLCQLDLTWCLPSLLDKYRSKPHQYVSWLLGDEGKGSLLSYLKRRVWALGIFTGNGETGIEHNSMYSLFSISVILTGEGLLKMKEVISAIFSYINMLKKMGPQKRIYDEIKLIEDISFRFTDEKSPDDYVEDLSESMHYYPPEDYITGSELYFEYDPEAITMVLNHLVPEKMNITITSNIHEKEIIYDLKEPWFGTPYTVKDIPAEWMQMWSESLPSSDMDVPQPNQFLTTDFTLLPEDQNNQEYPLKVVDTPYYELWYKQDHKFHLPTAYYNIYLISPLFTETVLSQCKTEILIQLLIIQLTETLYSATVAELLYGLSTSDRGIVIKISGYNQKLPYLVKMIAKHIKNLVTGLTEEMFEAVKDKLSNTYYNKLIKPATLAKDVRLSLLVSHYFTSTEKFGVIDQITFESIKEFCNVFFKKLYIKALVQGNVNKDVATEVIDDFVKTLDYLPLTNKDYSMFQVLEVPNGEKCCRIESFNKNDSNSIITNYYQAGHFNLKDSVTLELLMMIVEEPLFDILRTKEQLGYNVFCNLRDTFGILGYTITVNAQATKSTTNFVDERIESFIKSMFTKTLKKMNDKKLNQTKRDLIKMKQIADVVLSEEVTRNWTEIVSDDYMFDRLKQEISVIETLKTADIKQFWECNNAFGKQTNFKKLSVQIVGHNIKEENDKKKDNNMACAKDSKDTKPLNQPKLKTLKASDENEHGDNYFICDIQNFKKSSKYYDPSDRKSVV